MDNQNKSDKYDTFFDLIDAKFCEYFAVRSNLETLGCFEAYDPAEQYAKHMKAVKPWLNITVHKIIEAGVLLKEIEDAEATEKSCNNCRYLPYRDSEMNNPPCNVCKETTSEWRPTVELNRREVSEHD